MLKAFPQNELMQQSNRTYGKGSGSSLRPALLMRENAIINPPPIPRAKSNRGISAHRRVVRGIDGQDQPRPFHLPSVPLGPAGDVDAPMSAAKSRMEPHVYQFGVFVLRMLGQ